LPEPSLDPRRARFTALYDEHYHRILGYVQRRSARDDAVDLVAETFAIAWRRLDDVPQGEQTLFWLYATARRVLANHRRAERRRAALAQAIAHEPQVELAAAWMPGRELQRVAAALTRLREDERELLLLVAWEGLDAAALAAVLGCSRNAARIRVHRARRRFARALAAGADDVKHPGRTGHVVSVAGTLELEDSP
jgi:RNA polymerase sigma-70 factor (ECF subfamily)